jgi:CheY-like chemotaxis protein
MRLIPFITVWNSSRIEEKAGSGTTLPDFILLDINMPVLNGFSALAKIRSNPVLKNIPVFILTTSQSENDQLLSSELGANGFYTKPILFDQLIHILEEIVHCAEVIH